MTKILLIDDDELVSKSLKKLLGKQGYQVETAANAIEGITLAAKIEFDLVISDIRMPGDNGIVAVRKIQEIYKAKSIQAVYLFLSGYAEEDTPEHAIRLGVDKFLNKPIDNEELLKAVREELTILQSQRDLRKTPELSTPAIHIKKDSKHAGLKRVVITGIGCVSPNGIGRQAYWQGLREGRNCVDYITSIRNCL